MKKWEKYIKEELQEFCNQSRSYRQLCELLGYNPNEMVEVVSKISKKWYKILI